MLHEELGWSQQKSDELLLPVIQRVNMRGAAAAANKQSNLDAYFWGSVGGVGGSAIPRKRQAYSSKRLQKVVTDYREEQRRRSRTTANGSDPTFLDTDHPGEDVDIDESDDHGEQDPISGSMTRSGKLSKRTTTAKNTAPTKRRTVNERKVRKSSKDTTSAAVSGSTKRKKRTNDSEDCDDGGEDVGADDVTPVPARPRPKPVRKKANTNPGAEPQLQVFDQDRNEQS